MKKALRLLILLLAITLALTSCNATIGDFFRIFDGSSCAPPNGNNPDLPVVGDPNCKHTDTDDNGRCDTCQYSLYVLIDFYAINDLHGKFSDTDSNVGVDELTTYLKDRQNQDDHTVFLSSGDMWQGSPESNLTEGNLVTDWMNHLGFVSMTLGNHEYDWGEDAIEANAALADFPLLAVNVYDRSTNQRVDYCQPSVVVERGGIQIGIIGAMGNCYSSISGDVSGGFYFKTGSELTNLVKNEANKLRAEGVDYIVYSIHDGNDSGYSHYDTSLSDGYVDLVFEGHTHQKYATRDVYGVYHLQNGGENQGISHAEIRINSVTGTSKTSNAQVISASTYSRMSDDPIVEQLLTKYADQIAAADEVLTTLSRYYDDSEIEQIVAQLYYEYGVEKWGDRYDIVLGGGFLRTRSPYNLYAGEVTYGDLYSILPFDNNLVLCSIKGSDLRSKFFETSNEDYYIYYGSYGASVKNNIDPNATYYIVTDTYTSTYRYNNLTEVARITEFVFARDLLAAYFREGRHR